MNDPDRAAAPGTAAPAAASQSLFEFEAIMANAPVGIVFTRDQVITRYNARFAELVRLGEASWIGQPVRIFCESDRSFAALSEAAFPRLSSGQRYRGEMALRRHDQSIFAAEVVGYLVDPANPPLGTIWIVSDISERRANEERLEAAVRDLRAITRNASVGIAINRDGRIVEYNPRFAGLFGFEGDSGIGQPARVLYRNDDEYARLRAMARPRLAQGQPFQAELFMRRQDGSDLWVNLIGYAQDPANPALGSIWLAEDRSAAKRAEDELRESHARLEQRVADRTRELAAANERMRDFMEAAADWLWEMDSELRFTYFSHRIHKVLGTDSSASIGKTRQEIMHPEDIDEKWEAHFEQLRRREPFRDFEYRLAIPDGSFRDIAVSGKPIFDASGEFLGYRGIGRDVSGLRAAEKEIARKSALLQATLDNMTQGISVVDASLRMSAINRKFCELLEIPIEMAERGADFADFARFNAERGEYGPCDVEAKVRELTELARNPKPHHFRRRRPNGRILEISGNPLPEGGFVTTYTDVTEQETAEKALRDYEAETRAIIDNAPAAISLKDREGRYLRVNHQFETMFSLSAREVVGKTDHDLFPAEIADGCRAKDRAVIESGKATEVEESFVESGRQYAYIAVRFPLRDDSGEVYAIGEIDTDISERIAAEQDLRVAATMFESQEGMIVTDRDEKIVRVNKAFCTITGYQPEEVLGKTPRLLKSGRHDRSFYQTIWSSILDSGKWSGEIWNRRKNGEVYPQLQSITAVRGPDGSVSNFVGTFIDITQRKQAEEAIRDLAFYDPLTRLPNRRLLGDRLAHALTTLHRSGKVGALMFIDLDNFKSLNDTRGHQVGDQLLVEVAQRIREAVRREDTVARLGGDEFVIMLENLDASGSAAVQTEHVAAKVLRTFEKPFRIRERESSGKGPQPDYHYRCSASIGITLFDDPAQTVDDILKQADLSMYRAKAAGRNTLCFFDPAIQAEAVDRAALEVDLRDASFGEALTLHYQPQFSSRGELMAVEGLMRWQHPQRGMIPPSMFIPLAEQSGLIVALGYHALESACRQIVAWSREPRRRHIVIAVNVSAVQLRQEHFVDQVLAVLEATGADPARLKLEITESLLMEDPTTTAAKMIALRQKGIGFSLDDFGTGYSSLAYLKHLPLDQLKIDRSFVTGLPADANDAAICRTIVALGKSLEIDLVAEGVETREQFDFLRGIGCDRIQGYYFSRPLPVAELEALIERGLQPRP